MIQSEEDGRGSTHIELSATDRGSLLQMARDAISVHLLREHTPQVISPPPSLAQVAGVFVTLRCRTEEGLLLRGCIGQVLADQPLYKSVPEMALKAATNDPRFPPLTAEELPSLHISVSVLSPLKRLAEPEAFELGEHGLLIEGYGRRGLLLPEVPVGRGWNKQEFLQALCRKAGLPTDAWRSSRIKLFAFTSLEFEEPT